MNALFYNWWSLFVRLISGSAAGGADEPAEDAGRGGARDAARPAEEAAPSRTPPLRAAFEALARFLREIQNAERSGALRILSRAYLKYLVLKPPPGLLPA